MERIKVERIGSVHLLEVFILSLIVFLILIGATYYIPHSSPPPQLTLTPYLQQQIKKYNFSGIQQAIEEEGGKAYYISYIYKKVFTQNKSINLRCKRNIKSIYIIMEDGEIEKVCEEGKKIDTSLIDSFTSTTLLVYSQAISSENISAHLTKSPYTIYLIYYYNPYNTTSSSHISSSTLFDVVNDTLAYNLVVMS